MDTCPICKGTGKFEMPNKIKIDTVEIKRHLAVQLRKKGYSLRQIQKALGYKSVLSIQYLLKK
jgi:hypothetical protein